MTNADHFRPAWTARYLTHPQVRIDPDVPVPLWSLNDIGRQRVDRLASNLGQLAATTRVVSSNEVKAIETAKPIADALRIELEVKPRMHENDRSATGFLPPAEFEMVADQFFANPAKSIRGWETAQAAQARIVSEVATCLEGHGTGDVLFVGHGGVGTLLLSAIRGVEISRRYDQGPGGGGCWFAFESLKCQRGGGWMPMERL